MSARSVRSQRRAARVRNQRIAIIIIAVVVIASVVFFAFRNRSANQTGADDLITTSSGLQYKDLIVGQGPATKPGDTVSVHYTGWLQNNKKFDSSLDRGVPFDFTLGQNQVIQGWDEGVLGMRVGGKRRLIIPPQLAYGATGAGGIIPPNATLIFEIELLAIK